MAASLRRWGSRPGCPGELDHASIRELDRVDFDARLRELVRIRASQLNGCACCVDIHSRDARIVTINAWNALSVASRAWEPPVEPESP